MLRKQIKKKQQENYQELYEGDLPEHIKNAFDEKKMM